MAGTNWNTYSYNGSLYGYDQANNILYTYDPISTIWVKTDQVKANSDVAENKEISRLEGRADLLEIELLKLRKFHNSLSMRVARSESRAIKVIQKSSNFKTNILSLSVIVLSLFSMYSHGVFRTVGQALGF